MIKLAKNKLFSFRLILLILISLIILLTSSMIVFKQNQSDNNKVHVFIDCATGPILLQAVHLIQLPKNEKKLVAWHPFPSHPSFDSKKYNVEFIEWTQTNEWYGYSMLRELEKRIAEILKKNPKTKLVIHTDLVHTREFFFRLFTIPKKNIEMLHLYEDGIGNTAATNKHRLEQFSLDRNNPPTNPSTLDYPYFYHLKYPVTYHLAFIDEIKSNFPKMVNVLKDANLEEIDLHQLKTKLSKQDQQALIDLYNIDIKLYERLFKTIPSQLNKPSLALLISRPMGTQEEFDKELEVYKDIMEKDDYFYIFKPHPHMNSYKYVTQLQNTFDTYGIIENHYPIELFYLIDMEPDWIAGFSSSVFYSLPKKSFPFYIERVNDSYLPFLLKKGIIKKEQVINYHLQ